MVKYFQVVGYLLLMCGCGGAPSHTVETPAPEAKPVKSTGDVKRLAESAESSAADAADLDSSAAEMDKLIAALPTDCEKGQSCLPPPKFSRAACEGRFPGMAVAMFEKSTPWQRLYVKVERAQPVNTYGGPVSEPLLFTEEVLLLRDAPQSTASDIQVSGAADVDVLRWDGTCVTLRREFLAVHRMPTIKNATITWKYLDGATQEGLLQAKYVKIRYDQQRDACRKSSASNPSQACQRATEKLNDAITVAVRGGVIQLPEPEWLPTWKQASR